MSSSPRFTFKSKGNYIGGSFREPIDPSKEWLSLSPADRSDEIGRFRQSYQSVDEAVGAARAAFVSWRRQAANKRAEYARKYQAALERRQPEIAEAIAREIGKPLWEATAEVAAARSKIDVTLAEGLKWISDFEIPRTQEGVNAVCRYRPLGVMAVIGPFNFPAHLPNGQWIPALLAGNTVVFKPSEKAPMTAQLLAECWAESGLPAGVFNLVQGDREVGRRLSAHEGVDGVLFTGSYESGLKIKQDTITQHWKLLALEMGGKNPAIVWDDANLDVAIEECLVGAFITAGQRCSATARILVHRSRASEFIERFHQRSKEFAIGHPLESPFMGPVVDAEALDRTMKFIGIAHREGHHIVMRGKALELEWQGNYVTPTIVRIKDQSVESARKSLFQQTEIFAPIVSVTEVQEIDEAIALANATQYGLVASVFCANKDTYERFWDGLQFGMINWNKSTVGASSRLPFGGTKKSGNHRPAAIFASHACVAPNASLEIAEPSAQAPDAFPGIRN